MNRMLFLRDIEADVLISCRACGHEGVLPRAEVEARFGLNYPVLSIAPHFRCSNCNARDAESRPASVAGAHAPTLASMVEEETEDQLRATIAALQGLVDAAHDEPPADDRTAGVAAAGDRPPLEPPSGGPSLEDEVERDLARLLGDIGGLSDDDDVVPSIGPVTDALPVDEAAPDDDDDDDGWAVAVAAPSRRGTRPGLPERPFFRSREAPPPTPRGAWMTDEDEDGPDEGEADEGSPEAGDGVYDAAAPSAFAVVDRDAPRFDVRRHDAPPDDAGDRMTDGRVTDGGPTEGDETDDGEFALPAWMSDDAAGDVSDSDEVAFRGDRREPRGDDGDEDGWEEAAYDAQGATPRAFSVADMADEADEDDPLLSGALRRLLHDAPGDDAIDDDDDFRPGGHDDEGGGPSDAELIALALGEPVVGADAAEERELSDEELVALAVGEATAWGEDHRRDAGVDAGESPLVPSDWDDDEDEVYEYPPDEIEAESLDDRAPDLEADAETTASDGAPEEEPPADEDDVLLLDMALEIPADEAGRETEGGMDAPPPNTSSPAASRNDRRLIDTETEDEDDPMVGFDTAERWRSRSAAKGGDDESMEDALATLRALIEEAAADPEPASESDAVSDDGHGIGDGIGGDVPDLDARSTREGAVPDDDASPPSAWDGPFVDEEAEPFPTAPEARDATRRGAETRSEPSWFDRVSKEEGEPGGGDARGAGYIDIAGDIDETRPSGRPPIMDDPGAEDVVEEAFPSEHAADADAHHALRPAPSGEPHGNGAAEADPSERKGGGSLDDTLARLRGLLDLDAEEHRAKTPRAPVRRRK